MIESLLVVLSRALEGRDDEMNDWYTNIHIRDVLRYRGSIAVQRFMAAADQPGPLPASWPYRYLALYESYDAALLTQSHRDAADTVWMEISEAFDITTFNEFYYFPIIWRSNAIDNPSSGGVILEQFSANPGCHNALCGWYCDEHFSRAMGRLGVHSGALLAFRHHGQQLSGDSLYQYVGIYWLQDDVAASMAWLSSDLQRAPGIATDSVCTSRWHRLTERLTVDDVIHTCSADLAAEERARARLRRSSHSSRAVLGL